MLKFQAVSEEVAKNQCDFLLVNNTSLCPILHRLMAILPFKVIQGHRFWSQWKACMQLPVSE